MAVPGRRSLAAGAVPGFRTAQQHFVGSNSLKQRWGLPLLLEPPAEGRKKAEGSPLRRTRMQNTGPAPQTPQSPRLKPTSWDPHRANTGPPPDLHREPKGRTGRRNALRVPIQVMHYQALARPASERPHTPSRPLPAHCRCQVQSGHRTTRIDFPSYSSPLVQAWRKARLRELWRGG